MFKSIVVFYHILSISGQQPTKWNYDFWESSRFMIFCMSNSSFLYSVVSVQSFPDQIHCMCLLYREWTKRDIVLLPKIRLWSGGSSHRVNILFLVVSVRKLSLKLVFWQFRFLRKEFDCRYSSGTKCGPFMGLPNPCWRRRLWLSLLRDHPCAFVSFNFEGFYWQHTIFSYRFRKKNI